MPKIILKHGHRVGVIFDSGKVTTASDELASIISVWEKEGIEVMAAAPKVKGAETDAVEYVPLGEDSIGLLTVELEKLGFEVK